MAVELHRGRVATPSGVLLYMRPPGEVVEEVTRLFTEDVSLSGMFLRTDAPPKFRQVVRITLTIPGTHIAMNAMAQVAHVVHMNDSNGRVPGAGILFFPLDGTTFEAWSSFIDSLATTVHLPRVEEARALPMPPLNSSVIEPIRRRSERHQTSLNVHVSALGELHVLRLQDISHNGVFISTDMDFPVGTSLLVRIMDPAAQAEFAIEAVVRRRSMGAIRGVGVEFIGLEGELREEFFRFIEGSYRDVDLGASHTGAGQ